MSMDYSQLEGFKKQLESLTDTRQEFVEKCAKELAARFLAGTIKLTPVGQYPKGSGRVGGTLRRGWTVKTHKEAESGKNVSVSEYLDSIHVAKEGDRYTLVLENPVEYASYVEYGHRTKGGKGFVEGRHMMTVTEKQINSIAPKLLEKRLKEWLEKGMT